VRATIGQLNQRKTLEQFDNLLATKLMIAYPKTDILGHRQMREKCIILK
jgi:hypothetical protein